MMLDQIELFILRPSASEAIKDEEEEDEEDDEEEEPSVSPAGIKPSIASPPPSPPASGSSGDGVTFTRAESETEMAPASTRLSEQDALDRKNKRKLIKRTSKGLLVNRGGKKEESEHIAKRHARNVFVKPLQFAVGKAEEQAGQLRDVVGTAEAGIKAARKRVERGLIEIGPLPLEALLRAPEGSAVGFYYEPSSEDLPLDFGGLSVHGSEHVEGRHGSMIEANKLFGLIDENSSRVGEESGGTLHVPSSPRPPPPTDAPPAPAPPTTPPPLPPPPRFVVVDRMRRERRCCGLFRTGKIIASYSLDSAQSDNEVQPGMVIHPVEAHRRISHWYTEMINLGHGHDEVLEELERISKLPPGWRDSTMPYWGAFDGAKKRTGWRLNYLLHTLLIAILIMDYLITLQDTIPFTAVGESLLIGFFVEPLLEAVWLLFQIVLIFFILQLVRTILKKLGLYKRIGKALDLQAPAISSRRSRFVDPKAVALRSTNSTLALGSTVAVERQERRATVRASLIASDAMQQLRQQQMEAESVTSADSSGHDMGGGEDGARHSEERRRKKKKKHHDHHHTTSGTRDGKEKEVVEEEHEVEQLVAKEEEEEEAKSVTPPPPNYDEGPKSPSVMDAADVNSLLWGGAPSGGAAESATEPVEQPPKKIEPAGSGFVFESHAYV